MAKGKQDSVIGEMLGGGGRRRSSAFRSGLADIAQDEATILKVDPGACRLWSGHDRKTIDEEVCRDLIEGFRSVGRQLEVAIARPVEDDSGYSYEIVSGGRRHWVAGYLGWPLRIEVAELTDAEAFKINDLDNRDREDVAPLERARRYAGALKAYYASQKEMAEDLHLNVATLNQYLTLSGLPDEIFAAYGGSRNIRLRHSIELSKLLSDANAKKRIVARAEELAGDQAAREENGQDVMPPADVLRELKKAAEQKGGAGRKRVAARRQILGEYTTKGAKKPALTVSQPRVNRMEFSVRLDTASPEELRSLMEQAISKHLPQGGGSGDG